MNNINDSAALVKLILKINEAKIFAFDLEFIPENSFVPYLCLIQVLVEKEIYIIDPFKIENLSEFWRLFHDDQITKIVHAGKNDLEIIYGITNEKAVNIFDTQVAACFCGYGYQIGLAKLLKDLLSVFISKSQTRSNWSIRPLTTEQLIYAKNDVKYLFKAYEFLKDKVTELGRLDWVFQESVKYDFYYQKKIPQVKNLKVFASLKQYQLDKLAIERYEFAKVNNLPVKTIASDDALIEIVESNANNLNHLKKISGLSKDFVNQRNQQIIEIISNRKVDLSPWQENVKYFNKEKHLFLNELIYFIAKSKAIELNLPVEFLASKNDIEKIIFNFLQDKIDSIDCAVLKDWRREVIGSDLMAMLKGHTYTISIDNTRLSLELETNQN